VHFSFPYILLSQMKGYLPNEYKFFQTTKSCYAADIQRVTGIRYTANPWFTLPVFNPPHELFSHEKDAITL